MDSGSSASSRLGDPAAALERLQERRAGSFPALLAARTYTERQLADRRRRLADVACPEGVSVILFGSWARKELTAESDDDWAVLVDSDDLMGPAAGVERAARSIFGEGERKPGAQDIFGTRFCCDALVQQIGLEADSNTLLTRRMLLLLESVPVIGLDNHARCWDKVLSTYLDRGAKDFRPPRFLLNDVVRYWRTMCVDFEGKHWSVDATDPKWVTRNAKLRTSRKVLFAAGLVPLLACRHVPREEQVAFLSEQLRAVATDRLAEAFMSYDEGSLADAGVRGLEVYDRFVSLMAEGDVRVQLRELRPEDRNASELWREIKELGDQLQQSLLTLLFGPTLSGLTRQYAIF